MRLKITLLILVFLPVGLLAQKQVVDSLYNLLEKEKIDTNRINLMWEIGYELRVYDPVQALDITTEALSLAKRKNIRRGK